MPETYRKTRLPATRLLTIAVMNIGVKAHYVSGFLEIDVTDARRRIKEAKSRGDRISFTGWIMKCVASAAKEFPEINAYRKGRYLYMFETVNMGMMVERELKGEKVPLGCVIKDCDTKSVRDISLEIAEAKEGDTGDELVIADRRSAKIAKYAVMLPKPLHSLGARIFFWDPVKNHARMGTIGVTAVGMFGRSGGWPLPIPNVHSLALAVGGISRKPRYIGGGDELEPRDMLDLTLMFNHDVIDGAPAARFSARLIEMMETAYGLER
ncbi:MAG: 2-oxo acid dehydrogenase subunit E2 [Actinomycetota bacterium]